MYREGAERWNLRVRCYRIGSSFLLLEEQAVLALFILTDCFNVLRETFVATMRDACKNHDRSPRSCFRSTGIATRLHLICYRLWISTCHTHIYFCKEVDCIPPYSVLTIANEAKVLVNRSRTLLLNWMILGHTFPNVHQLWQRPNFWTVTTPWH